MGSKKPEVRRYNAIELDAIVSLITNLKKKYQDQIMNTQGKIYRLNEMLIDLELDV